MNGGINVLDTVVSFNGLYYSMLGILDILLISMTL